MSRPPSRPAGRPDQRPAVRARAHRPCQGQPTISRLAPTRVPRRSGCIVASSREVILPMILRMRSPHSRMIIECAEKGHREDIIEKLYEALNRAIPATALFALPGPYCQRARPIASAAIEARIFQIRISDVSPGSLKGSAGSPVPLLRPPLSTPAGVARFAAGRKTQRPAERVGDRSCPASEHTAGHRLFKGTDTEARNDDIEAWSRACDAAAWANEAWPDANGYSTGVSRGHVRRSDTSRSGKSPNPDSKSCPSACVTWRTHRSTSHQRSLLIAPDGVPTDHRTRENPS